MTANKIKLLHIVAALFIHIGLARSGFADMTYVQEQKIFVNGQIEGPYIITTYITATKMKTDLFIPGILKHDVTIVDLDKMKLFSLNNKNRRYIETDLETWMEGENSLPAELQDIKAKITVTGETMRIQNYECTKIVADMGAIKQISWVTPAIKTDKAAVEFNNSWGRICEDFPYISNMNAVWRQYRELNSFPVKIIIDISASKYKARREMILKSHNYDKIDPAVFEIPKEYKPFRELNKQIGTNTEGDTE